MFCKVYLWPSSQDTKKFLIHQKHKLYLLVYILLSLQMDGYKKLLSLFNGKKKKKELFFIRTLKDIFTSFDHTDF